ncbi:MAG: alpha/beta hydrolase [Actinomycetota bacterium]|nr:alpha/beta hydrolase [Actinomycetota bacterium]
MTTFLLVHGAGHGAWCWEYVVEELEAAGHAAIAVDLPCEDPAAGCTAYAAVCLDALRGVGGDVVVVGHSLAGLTIPLVAAAPEVRRLVYLCALLPLPGVSGRAQLESDPAIRPAGHARDLPFQRMYHDCTREAARWALRRMRPQADAPYDEPCPLTGPPAVPSAYVACDEDRFVSPEWARRAAPERLGVEPLRLPGGHAPFLSRPRELARLLTEIGASDRGVELLTCGEPSGRHDGD